MFVHGDLVPPPSTAARAVLPAAHYRLMLVLNADDEMHVRSGIVELREPNGTPVLPKVLDDGDVIVTHAEDGALLRIEFLAAEERSNLPQFERHCSTSRDHSAVLRSAHATILNLWRSTENAIKVILARSPNAFREWNRERAKLFAEKLGQILALGAVEPAPDLGAARPPTNGEARVAWVELATTS